MMDLLSEAILDELERKIATGELHVELMREGHPSLPINRNGRLRTLHC